MGAKNVGDHDSIALDAVEERLRDTVPVDQNAVAALALGDEVGVREPVRMLGAFEDQNSTTLLIPSCASMSSKPRFTSASLILWEMNGSTSISPASQRSTSCGT